MLKGWAMLWGLRRWGSEGEEGLGKIIRDCDLIPGVIDNSSMKIVNWNVRGAGGGRRAVKWAEPTGLEYKPAK